ncbi:MAG: M1 family aminopeptidase [Acidobacteriota bacterium]
MSKPKTGILWILLLAAMSAPNADLLARQAGPTDRPAEEPAIDVVHYDIDAELELDRSYIHGHATVTFQVLEQAATLPFNLSRHLTITDVTDSEGRRLAMRGDEYSRDQVRIEPDHPLRVGSVEVLNFEFEGNFEPEQYAFVDSPETQKAVIDRNGATLLTDGYWFPSHRLPLDAATVSLRMTVPLGFTVVAPGVLGEIETVGVSEAFNWTSDQPTTKLPVLVARYYRQKIEGGSIPLTFYVTDDYKADPHELAEKIWDILDFFSQQYGPIPIQNLDVIESGNLAIPAQGSVGMLLLEDKLLKAPTTPVAELAGRVALQWWGYSVRIARPMDAWLSDGFARYSALRYIQEKKPDQFETDLSKYAVDALKYQDQAPVASGLDLEAGTPKYESIVASKGAWVLYMLGRLAGADTVNAALKSFYEEYAGKAATIKEFTGLFSQRAGQDYGWFFTQWLESVGVPEFRLDYTIYKLRSGGFKIEGQVKQNLDLFRMPMEVRIETKGQPEDKEMMVDGKSTSFTFDTETMPVKLDLDPNGKILMDSDRMRVSVAIAMGDEYSDQGEFVSAIEEYEKAVDLNPRSSLAHFRLGSAYFAQHSYSNAANSMRDCLNGDLKPDWVETWAHIYLGKVYDVLGQRQRAKAEYRKAINTKVDYNGAQAEAQKYFDEPFTKPSSVIG